MSARSRRGSSVLFRAATAGVMLLVLAGCGSGSKDVSAAATSPSAAAPSTSSAAAPSTSAAAPSTTGAPSAAPSSAAQTTGGSNPAAAPAPAAGAAPAAQGTGNIAQVVPTKTLAVSPPVGLKATSAVGGGLSVALSDVRSTTATARLPGEVGGPAVSVKVTYTNRSDRPVDLRAVTVNLAGADEVPADLIGTASTPMGAAVAAGATASGTYVFSNKPALVQPVSISVLSSTGAPVARFVGPVK